MLDRRTFDRELVLLFDRFGRELGTPTVNRYYQFLADRLTTAAFEAAAKEIFEQDTFWPSPQRFIDAAAGGSSQDLAEAAWTQVLTWAQRGEYPPLETLEPGTRTALKAAPMREIQYADSEAKLARLRRAFLAAHQAAPVDLPTLELPPGALDADLLLESR